MASEFERKPDHLHTSGPQDLARLLQGTSNTRVVTSTRPEGRVDAQTPPR